MVLQESFKPNLLVMRVVGLHPKKTWGKSYMIYSWVFYALFTVPVTLLATIYLLVVDETDIQVVNDSVFLISQIGILIIRQVPIIIHPKKVRATLDILDSPMFNQFEGDQQKIMQECINTCRRNFNFFFTCCLATVSTWAVRPLFARTRMFPIHIWLPFDGLANELIFCTVYIFIVLGVCNPACSNGAVDTLLAGLTYHAVAQLRILKDNLQNLHKYLDNRKECTFPYNGQRNDVYRRIVKCVEHHEYIYRYVCDIEERFSFIVFIQFIASIFVICLSCLQLTWMEPFSFGFYQMIVYLSTMLLQIFLYCYYGTLLYIESSSLTDAVYMGDWYLLDKRCKDALIILMERAKRPMMVTAGKVLNLSLDTFIMILRRAYSLFAVLKNY